MAWVIERVTETTSTMDLAKAKARGGGPDRWAVVAERMTSGRGTQGRSWHAPEGGLYTSFILRNIQDPHLLTLALGCAVADVLEVAGVDAQLKWVNDVWVGGRKVAGILVEAESTGPTIDVAVCGIGININGHARDFPTEVPATTVEDELGCESCIPDLEVFLWQSIDRWLGRLSDPQQVISAFRTRDALAGKRVKVESGAHKVEGLSAGIDDRGRLLVRVGAKTESVQSGSVTLLA